MARSERRWSGTGGHGLLEPTARNLERAEDRLSLDVLGVPVVALLIALPGLGEGLPVPAPAERARPEGLLAEAGGLTELSELHVRVGTARTDKGSSGLPARVSCH